MQGPQLRFRLEGQEKEERASTDDSLALQPLHTSPHKHAPPLEHF